MEIESERVEIAVGDQTMGAYVARREGGDALPAVIVYMEIFGVNSHIRDITERVAREGYVAIAPDYFHRSGPGVEYDYDEEGMGKGMQLLGQLVADEMIADARATIEYLRSRDDVRGEKIGAMGFCIGGHMTYLTACETDVVASASYYGGGIAAPQGPGGADSTLSRTPKLKGRLVCYFGGQDALIPKEQVDAIHDALAGAGSNYEIVVYDEADHGFNCDQRATYHEPSAKDSWERTKKLFSNALKG